MTKNEEITETMTVWQVHIAKSRFSELLQKAESEGPQIITRHGKETAVVLSAEEFRRLEAAKPDFKEYLLSGPKFDSIDLPRDMDSGRDVEL